MSNKPIIEVFMPADPRGEFRVVFQTVLGVDGAFWNGFRLYNAGQETGAYDGRAWNSFACAAYDLFSSTRLQAEASVPAVTPEHLKQMREWMLDCKWIETEEELSELSDIQVAYGIAKHYAGGVSQFILDCAPVATQTNEGKETL